jgi:5'-3' exonuclease
MDKITFIDFSYFIFYRYYAIKRWQQYRKEITSTDFPYLIYHRKFVSVLKEFSNETNYLYLVKDSPSWRKEYFENYKSTRKHNKEIDDVFNYTYNSILNNKDNIKYNIIQIDHLEADDIIAVMSNKLCNKYSVTIVSEDKDYYQILDPDKDIKIININKKEHLFDKSKSKQFLLEKILYGDKSDNIPNIRVGRNKKKLLTDPLLLESMMTNNKEFKIQFELNRMLIDFDYISKKYINQIEKEIIRLNL